MDLVRAEDVQERRLVPRVVAYRGEGSVIISNTTSRTPGRTGEAAVLVAAGLEGPRVVLGVLGGLEAGVGGGEGVVAERADAPLPEERDAVREAARPARAPLPSDQIKKGGRRKEKDGDGASLNSRSSLRGVIEATMGPGRRGSDPERRESRS